MKYGYSNLLGELIDAIMIDYEDCKSFQIVCPCCKEPVFKVKRDQIPTQPLHYLSHYEKSASIQEDCDLRVNSLGSDEVRKENEQSRNQKLNYFLEVLRNAVLENEYGTDKSKLNGMFNKMEKSKGLSFLRNRFYEFIKKSDNLVNKENVYENFDEYIKEITRIAGGFPKTAFSISNQKRIAYDVWLQILSPNSRDNFDFMFNNSFLFLMFRIEKLENVRPWFEYEKRIHSSMLGLIESSESDGMNIIASMMKFEVPKPHSIGLDLLSKMLAEISHEIFGCLLRIPYFQLLKSAK